MCWSRSAIPVIPPSCRSCGNSRRMRSRWCEAPPPGHCRVWPITRLTSTPGGTTPTRRSPTNGSKAWPISARAPLPRRRTPSDGSPAGKSPRIDFPRRPAHIALSRSGGTTVPFLIPYPDIDPAIFTLAIGSFQFSLRWYALAYIAGLVIGWRIILRLMRAPTLWPGNRAPRSLQQPEELLTWMVFGVVLGGRLGFVRFYSPCYYLSHPAEMHGVWSVGMSFHGGMIGARAAVYLYCRRNGLPVLQVGDAVAIAVPVGLFFGRIANYSNAELWGRPNDVPWAMQFPRINPNTGERDWTMLTEPRHPSQLYEAGLEGLVLFAALLWLALSRRWLKSPGAITGAFLAGYGAARIFVENFRQGDAQFITAANTNGHVLRLGTGPAAFGCSMRQILSLRMLLAGLLLIMVVMRRTALSGVCAQASAPMTPIQHLLRREIAETGPRTVARFMELCLAHPEHVYYRTRDPLG